MMGNKTKKYSDFGMEWVFMADLFG